MAQGPGVVQWFVEDKSIEVVDGEWQDGKLNGHGAVTGAAGGRLDGVRYDGKWRDSRPSGHGVVMFADGNRYDGEFRDGKLSGHGVFTFATGNRYDGEFLDGKASGVGALTFVNGVVYNGYCTTGCFRDGDRRAAVGVELSSCP